jgi:hypothetical protein
MLTLNERFVVTSSGDKVGVFLDIVDFQRLTKRLAQLESVALLRKELNLEAAAISGEEVLAKPTLSVDDLRQTIRHAFTDAGFDTREKIVELVREIRREISSERIPASK